MRCEIFIANALQFNTKPASNTDVRRLKVALRVALDERRLETRLRSNPYRHMSIVMVVIGEHYEDLLVHEKSWRAVRELFRGGRQSSADSPNPPQVLTIGVALYSPYGTQMFFT